MGFSESTSLGEIGSLTYKDVKRLFCGGGADIGAIELDKENQKMVVMCDADNVGWGTETMEGLVGDWLKEGNKVLGWSSNKMGELVSGTVTEFRIFLDVNGIKCVMTNSNLVMQVVDKVDTVAEMVIFVNQVARVGGMW